MVEPTSERRFSIDELAGLVGVTPRTVRYYISEGLVDRPEGEKRGAYYVERHLDQLLQARQWSESGLSLDRIRDLRAGAADDPPPRRVKPGTVEVWSRVTLADGLEIQIEPGRADLSPEQLRALVLEITAAYRRVRDGARTEPGPGPDQPSQNTQGDPT